MRICVPVPETLSDVRGAAQRTAAGSVGVIDNSKPRFEVLARAALAELGTLGFTHTAENYVKKPSPTRPATDGEIERLGKGTVAVLIGSGD